MLDERVRDRIIAETRGNPLALLELPRGMTATQLAGGFGVPAADAVPDRIEESFVRRLEPLPDDACVLLLIAAAEPVGDPLLLWRAAERLGIGPEAATGAADDGLLVIGERVMFRHPLVRSAMYRSAAAEERRAVHLALAEATDREADPALLGRRRPVHRRANQRMAEHDPLADHEQPVLRRAVVAAGSMPRRSAARQSRSGSPTGSAAATSSSRRVSSGSGSSRRAKLASIRPGQRVRRQHPEPAGELRRGQARAAAPAGPAGCPASPR